MEVDFSKAKQANELLEKWAAVLPGKTYLYFEEQEVTYRRFQERVNSAAHHFQSLGIGKGDRIALYLLNCPEFLYAWFGLNKIGAIMVPVNTGFRSQETAFILKNAGCRGIIVDGFFLENIVKPAAAECPTVEWIALRGKSSDPNILSFDDFLSHKAHIETVRWPEEELAAILYTSGTTGNPKGVMCPHRYYATIGYAAEQWLSLTQEDRLLTILPLFHMNAQTISTMDSLGAGASLILVNGFNPMTFWPMIGRYGATIFNYLGLMLPFLAKMPISPEEERNPVRYACGAQADPNMIEEFEKRWKLKMIELYGMTEVGGTCNPVNGKRIGSCGVPLPGHEIRIVDEWAKELPVGQIGEIIAKGPSMTLGYWNNPEETAKTYKNGWVFTGDMGYLDADGFLFFAGRKKDIIRRSGENIAAAEVENCLMGHPGIAEAAAIPVPDPVRDEEVKVYVVLKEVETPETVPPEAIVEWCLERLAKFKVPRYVEYIDSLPKTPTQKVKKVLLIQAKKDLTEGAWDRFAKKV
jgi:acyl-CoA synthetase (AMP-forming)/AMP-acid ligase II